MLQVWKLVDSINFIVIGFSFFSDDIYFEKLKKVSRNLLFAKGRDKSELEELAIESISNFSFSCTSDGYMLLFLPLCDDIEH